MKLLKKAAFCAFLSSLAVLSTGAANAADLLYNLKFELTNASGGDFLTTATFSADPTKAVTGSGTGPLGETYKGAIDSLALTVFSLGTAPFTDTSVNYSLSNVPTSAAAWYTASNFTLGTADPVFTVSAPDSAGFLTVVLAGTATEIFQSSTLGGTTGTPLVSGPGVLGTSFDANPTPEPASIGLMLTAGLLAGGLLLRRKRV